eukprot:Selendium_serpulae@DN1658_c0_g1_i2.p2
MATVDPLAEESGDKIRDLSKEEEEEVVDDETRFSSRWAFVVCAIGSAVGLGNVWKFPYLVYEYGGGAFFIPYVLSIVLIGIPMAGLEFSLARAGRRADGRWRHVPEAVGARASRVACRLAEEAAQVAQRLDRRVAGDRQTGWARRDEGVGNGLRRGRRRVGTQLTTAKTTLRSGRRVHTID